jgi:chemotaxis protein histidine kinase CheA
VTFGLLDVVVVVVDGRKYLIDAAHVIGRHAFVANDVEISESIHHLKMVDEYLRLHFLSQLLEQGIPDLNDEPPRTVLVCEAARNDSTGPTHVALLVDDAVGPQKVLVRNLGSRGSRWFGVAGASELRDGTVALLLDLPRLLNS